MHSIDTLSDTQLETLQALAQLNIDSRDGFHYAIQKLPDDAFNLKHIFEAAAEQRERAILQLNGFILSAAEQPAREGSYRAALHRSIMALRDLFATSTEEYAVLAEAERGEDTILRAYQDAVSVPFPPEIHSALIEQSNEVKIVHDRVKALRDARK